MLAGPMRYVIMVPGLRIHFFVITLLGSFLYGTLMGY